MFNLSYAHTRRRRCVITTPLSPRSAALPGEGTGCNPNSVSVTLLYCTGVESDHPFPNAIPHIPVPNIPIGTSPRMSVYGPGSVAPINDQSLTYTVEGPPENRTPGQVEDPARAT